MEIQLLVMVILLENLELQDKDNETYWHMAEIEYEFIQSIR